MTSKFEFAAPMAVPPTWTFPNTFGALSPQLVAAGDKLIAVAGRTVFALDIHTGELAHGAGGLPWMIELQGSKGREPNVTTSKGVVYLMDDDSLLAYGLGDGQPIASWPKARKPQVPQCKRLLVHEGRLVALNTGKGGSTVIRGFDPVTGEQKFGPFERAEKSATHMAYGAKAVFLVASGALLALNADFGDERWRFKPADDVLDSAMDPLVTQNIVFAGGNNALHGLDTKTGARRYKIAATSTDPVHWYTPVAAIPKKRAAATQTANLKVVRPLLGDVLGAQAVLRAEVQRVAGGTGVAVNDAGDIIGFRIADGSQIWRRHLTLPGAPVLLDGVVYITTDSGKAMRQFDVHTGDPVAVPFDLATPSNARPAVIANGNLFSINATGNIEARAFAIQHAAYFDGKSTHIKVSPSAAQYDFGTGDFTVEAWFRSSSGGEIISSYPTNQDANAHGFRLRLEGGQVRVAVLNRNGASRHVGATSGTGADDGEWHHVAFVRRVGQFLVVLDGVSQTVNLGASHAPSLSIGGVSALTIGAFIFPGVEARQFFRGQIREVRVWNHAVDVVNIAANRDAELTGMEARLKGLWRLDEDQRGATKKTLFNLAHRNRMSAEFVNPDSRITDLTMDQSAFPYLLHEPRVQWPYAGTWGARGKNTARGVPTRSSDGIVAFATSDAIYAVDAHDGHRFWAMDVRGTTSAPVADGASFLFMTYEDSLVRVDSRNGAKLQVAAFADMPHEADGAVPQFPPPAVSTGFIAAANQSAAATVMIWDRVSQKANAAKLSGRVVHLKFCDQGLLVLTEGAAGARSLQLLDPASAAVLGKTAVASDVFCAAGTWVFAVRANAVVKFAAMSNARGGPLGGEPLATSAAIDGTITGLAASIDDDLIVATTSSGRAYRMKLGALEAVWDKTVPLGTVPRRTSIHPPMIDTGGRVICASESGSIAALDGETGQVMALYAMEHSPLAQPAIGAGGTLFVTCQDSITNDMAENVDGAMHSLVLGDTTVLRLNMDASGRPVSGNQHAVIDVPADSATLHLLEVHESCVEAWINAPRLAATDGVNSGGGILSILPSAESKFDIHLWLEPDGMLHYTSRAFDNGTWSGLHYTVQTTLLDGQWHHIAASRTPPTPAGLLANANATDRVLIYIDGLQVAATRAGAPLAPAATCTGLKAFIGANAADDLSATRPFHGMIAEVRVWDTWLVAPEITLRMHTKLRGDEPDLLAYWNFDHATVHDGAVQGHDGVLAQPVTDPVWWLTELPFSQPSYPHIVSSGAVSSAETGQPTTYKLTLKVYAADGKGMGNEDVHLWYVKKRGAPAGSIIIDGEELHAVDSAEEVHPLLLGQSLRARHAEQLKKAWKGSTASDGTITLSITAPAGVGNAASGPTIDMWTAFMPLNERFHVNVLIDGQKLAKPAPPRLTAQAKLIQDYHHTTGSKIDHTRDRSTWRTVIRAASASDRPRPYEPITLWASEPLTFEVNSKSYSVTKDNAVTIDTEADGELTMVMPAVDLSAPTIYARAGFMHRDDRMLINPDQDAHAQLADIPDAALTTERSTNWKRPQDRKASDNESLLPADAKGEAPKVGNAVRQVARATKPADENAPPRSLRMSPAREKLLSMRRMPEGERQNLLHAGRGGAWRQPRLAAMVQPLFDPKSDLVVPRRTLCGMARIAPTDPEAFRDSLDGTLGFVFEKTAKHRVLYTPLLTQAQVDAARGKATPVLLHAPLLGGFFDDLWDGVKDAANAVADVVTKVVVTITDTINLAVTTMVDGLEKIVHSVVSSVKDALNAIANFFEQIGAEIAKVIAFLRALFDWGNIIETHHILRDIFNASLDISVAKLRDSSAFIKNVRGVAGASVTAPKGGKSMNGTTASAPEKEMQISRDANSVQGKSMTQKTKTTAATSTGNDGRPAPDPAGGTESPFDAIAAALPKLADSILDLSPDKLFEQLKAIGEAAATSGIIAAATAMSEAMDTVATTMEWTRNILNAKIEIPFVSELYKWVTGTDLTIMSVLCLALAIPVNIAYAVFTLVLRREARFFFNDGKQIAANMRKAAGLPPRLGEVAEIRSSALVAKVGESTGESKGEIPLTDPGVEFLVILLRTMATAGDMGAELVFLRSHASGRDPTPEQKAELAVLNIMQGIAGTMALSVQMFESQKRFEDRVRYIAGADADKFLPPYIEISYTIYGIFMALRANKLRAGLTGYFNPGAAAGLGDKIKDAVEYPLACGGASVALGALCWTLGNLPDRYATLKQYPDPHAATVAEEFLYMTIRDILCLAGAIFEPLYTEKGVKKFRARFPAGAPWVLGASANTRAFGNLGAIVMHGIAVYKYGD